MLSQEQPVSMVRKDYKRLTEDEIREIINQRSNGVPAMRIAQQFSCSERQIHRIIKKNANGEPLIKEKREVDVLQRMDQSVLQEHHLAWIQEECLIDPTVSLQVLTERLNKEFNMHVSPTTIWRKQREGVAEKVAADVREEIENFMAGGQILQ